MNRRLVVVRSVDDLRPAEDGVERGAQFVRHHGEELVLQPAGGFGVLAGQLCPGEEAPAFDLGVLAIRQHPAQRGFQFAPMFDFGRE